MSQPTVLLVLAPAERLQTLWRELTRRLLEKSISVSGREAPAGIVFSVATQLGPILALTSWSNLLSVLEHEAANDPHARGDLVQLRALCDAADNDAFAPFSRQQLSDQRNPAFLVQLTSIVRGLVTDAETAGVVSLLSNPKKRSRLLPQASWERIGHYVWLPGDRRANPWLGIHLGLWKAHGTTPLWVVFSEKGAGRAQEVRSLIEPWAERNDVLTATIGREFAVALEVPVGEEKANVVQSLVNDLKAIAGVLVALPPRSLPSVEPESDETLE